MEVHASMCYRVKMFQLGYNWVGTVLMQAIYPNNSQIPTPELLLKYSINNVQSNIIIHAGKEVQL